LERLTKAYFLTATVGVVISIYVANEYLTANFQGCYINQQFSCEGVFQSGHTSLFGVPFYVTGLVWFPLMAVVGFLTTKLGREPLNAEILLPILMVGNVFTGYLWYLELAVIGIICPLCVSLYIVNYALTALVLRTVI
jgi:uncharacterized membrane protein